MDINLILSSIFYFYMFYVCIKILEGCQKGEYHSNKIRKEKDAETKISNLDKVIGLEDVKEEIRYYMDFIKNNDKYVNWNVNLPKGVLLVGPPGTGKTLLVKLMAKELDIPIITASGSEFVEVYVGVGAKRVRELFKKARKHESCIIFIDEIDAVGSKRLQSHNSEKNNTLNQLLVEMDGFNETSNLMVFAATNLVKNLDSALTRSGRFDKKIFFDPPNKREREQLYKLYIRDFKNSEIRIDPNVSFEILADRSSGLTGADIANVCNQAKMNAIRRLDNFDELYLDEIDIQMAIDEVMIGREKRERMMSDEERVRVAHHEAGHALMGYLLSGTNPPLKVSIIPRGQSALGFSQPMPEDRKLYTRDYILSQICVLLGGRSAELILYENLSTGASDDIEKVSSLITNYHVSWGMNSKIGPLNINMMDPLGSTLSDEIFQECKGIVDQLEQFTIQLLTDHLDNVKVIAKNLLEYETISYQKIKELLPDNLENSVDIIDI